MHYHISYQNPNSHFIDIALILENLTGSKVQLELPAWRPGRYEMANFSRNIQKMAAFDALGKPLTIKKVSRHQWEVETSGADKIIIKYNYYAFVMDAGNSWLDDRQLYINFINCLLYAPYLINEECSVTLELPADYKIACGLESIEKNTLRAPDYYRLVDSPMFASNTLVHLSYEVAGYNFHIWLQGNAKFDPDKLIFDFRRFTEVQIKAMGEFPCPEYHFLIQVLPYKHYHGVEHYNSTVITLGPAEKFTSKDFYYNLLGVGSHELFHTWNVIRIRPKEMMPYNFSKENYFQTGFIAEGFTTYYGDLFLVKGGVFSVQDYLQEINTTLFRHFDNFGRDNLSLAASSFDLWVDGYTAGIPDRKVSIYVTGAVMAVILDLSLRKETKNEFSLDWIMRSLWLNFGRNGIGYSMEDFQEILNKVDVPISKAFLKDFIFGNKKAEPVLKELLPYFGCRLESVQAEGYEGSYGFKVLQQGESTLVSSIQPGSIAERFLSKDDELVAVDGRKIEKNIAELISEKKEVELSFFRNKDLQKVTLKNEGINYYQNWRITLNPDAAEEEKINFRKWLGKL